MTLLVKHIKEAKYKEPMVVLPLRQYETLIEYVEDMEDRIAIRERANDENISWEEVKKEIKKKLAKK